MISPGFLIQIEWLETILGCLKFLSYICIYDKIYILYICLVVDSVFWKLNNDYKNKYPNKWIVGIIYLPLKCKF